MRGRMELGSLAMVAVLSWAGSAAAQQPLRAGERLPEGAHVVVPAAPDDFEVKGQPQFYQEYLVTSPGIRPSYVPGFIPKVSPRFLNPRIRPDRGTAANYFSQQRQFQEMPGGHFHSTTGFQKTGVTADSPVGDYHLGNAGITRVLQFGYPEGQRVIEPVLVPMPARSEKAGWYIDAGRPTQVDLGLGESTNFPEKRGQRSNSSLPRNSGQLANPNSDCAPTGQADGYTGQGQWVRENRTEVQHYTGRR